MHYVLSLLEKIKVKFLIQEFLDFKKCKLIMIQVGSEKGKLSVSREKEKKKKKKKQKIKTFFYSKNLKIFRLSSLMN